ncbi:TcC31.12 [Trypanosoma cruzi]|uniref:TcC31.12 n=1 Tax=Trypanosoma cruzi TaxID=5693 RepID=A0A2V2V4X4_TRYCR|nr:TcC31.12 [Trypanosoma cruzi]
MRHAGGQFFNHRGSGGYGVTLFVCGGHFGHVFMCPLLSHQGSATTIIRNCPGDCAGDIPDESSAGSGLLGREIATHHRGYNRKRIIEPTEKASAAIIRDASLHGWGVVFIPDSSNVKIAGGKWKKMPFLIMQAEARAVRLALLAFSAILPRTIDVWMSNTSLQGAANKGNSKPHAMTRELKRIYGFLDPRGIKASFAHVRSAETRRRHITRSCFHTRGISEGERRGLVAGGAQSLPRRR